MIKKYHIYIYTIFIFQCAPQVNVDQDLSKPVYTEADLTYKNVYAPLDGIWQGTFHIYTDPEGQRTGQVDHRHIGEYLDAGRPHWQSDSLQVRQTYHSLSPYFQKVTITDTYIKDGDTTLVIAEGVNKVEQGKMWYVVQKPDEKIVHLGELQGGHTIIWSRNANNPLRKEYFKETVSADSYDIIGYGYYGEDDPHLLPKTWFFARYNRISDYLR